MAIVFSQSANNTLKLFLNPSLYIHTCELVACELVVMLYFACRLRRQIWVADGKLGFRYDSRSSLASWSRGTQLKCFLNWVHVKYASILSEKVCGACGHDSIVPRPNYFCLFLVDSPRSSTGSAKKRVNNGNLSPEGRLKPHWTKPHLGRRENSWKKCGSNHFRKSTKKYI